MPVLSERTEDIIRNKMKLELESEYQSLVTTKCVCFSNSEYPNEIPHIAAFHQG